MANMVFDCNQHVQTWVPGCLIVIIMCRHGEQGFDCKKHAQTWVPECLIVFNMHKHGYQSV